MSFREEITPGATEGPSAPGSTGEDDGHVWLGPPVAGAPVGVAQAVPDQLATASSCMKVKADPPIVFISFASFSTVHIGCDSRTQTSLNPLSCSVPTLSTACCTCFCVRENMCRSLVLGYVRVSLSFPLTLGLDSATKVDVPVSSKKLLHSRMVWLICPTRNVRSKSTNCPCFNWSFLSASRNILQE